MRILTLVIGIILISFIVWWFFGKHQASQANASVKHDTQSANVVVNGGYSPENVVLKQGVPAKLKFTRKDASSCLDHVVFPDFGINQALPINKTETIKVNTKQAGQYQWHCGMNMFYGKLIVK